VKAGAIKVRRETRAVIRRASQNFTNNRLGGMRRFSTRKPISVAILPAFDAFWP
jgi:hypothetical protein